MVDFLSFDWLSILTFLAVMLLSVFFVARGLNGIYKQRLSHFDNELVYKDCSLNAFIIAKCKLKERIFDPNIFLRSKHVQTLLTCILPTPEVTYERDYLQMRDRGVVAIDWVTSPHVKLKRKSTLLVILPSLSKGALSVSSICHAASVKGMQSVVVNYRGHAGSVLTTAKMLSFGDPSDLRQVIKYLKLRMPKANLAAVALGTGCGLLLSYLGEFGSSALLSVGVCISPCYNEPFRFSSEIRSKYDLLLLLRLKSLVCLHAKALSSVIDVDKALSAWTFWDFQQALYGPLYGLTNVEDFWEANNSIRDVDDIAIPILCINSRDDPVCSNCDIPYDLFKCYPNFFLILTQRGGHCGFWEGFPPKSWVDPVCLDYIEAVVEFTTKLSHTGSLTFQGVEKTSNHNNFYRRTSFNRSFSSSSRRCGSPSNHIEVGSAISGMRFTRTPLKRCRFTI